MNYVVVIPAHNEEESLSALLKSLCDQTHLPQQVVLVNDNSTDATAQIMHDFAEKNSFISYVNYTSSVEHLPGEKVIKAFNYGKSFLQPSYDAIAKLDADLILPTNYFEEVLEALLQEKTGIAGGFCYEKSIHGEWVKKHPMHEDHVRGAFKTYRKDCFEAIGGLRSAMGWDTVDELLARFNDFRVQTLAHLKVKHVRPLGANYSHSAAKKQGRAFYQMRYGSLLSFIAALKSGLQKKSLPWLSGIILGYFSAMVKRPPYFVSKEEGRFIRQLRWEQIRARKNHALKTKTKAKG
ncbi:MAG: glycosyltransferase family 2 protein [Flavobacteriaceae bacterium]